MSEWFQCTVKYAKVQQDGSSKDTTEPYLVDAISFTEAERRIIEEISPFMTGAFEVKDIKKARYAELIESSDEAADRFFKFKLAFITLDEKTGKEKKTTQQILVQAADLRDSIVRIDAEMKGTAIDFSIVSVTETLIMDVYHYATRSKKDDAPEYETPAKA